MSDICPYFQRRQLTVGKGHLHVELLYTLIPLQGHTDGMKLFMPQEFSFPYQDDYVSISIQYLS